MNCECWERSRAESTSSRMYKGAGLKSRRERIRDRATRERCPPESSLNESFHFPPKATLTSSPSSTS